MKPRSSFLAEITFNSGPKLRVHSITGTMFSNKNDNSLVLYITFLNGGSHVSINY